MHQLAQLTRCCPALSAVVIDDRENLRQSLFFVALRQQVQVKQADVVGYPQCHVGFVGRLQFEQDVQVGGFFGVFERDFDEYVVFELAVLRVDEATFEWFGVFNVQLFYPVRVHKGAQKVRNDDWVLQELLVCAVIELAGQVGSFAHTLIIAWLGAGW